MRTQAGSAGPGQGEQGTPGAGLLGSPGKLLPSTGLFGLAKASWGHLPQSWPTPGLDTGTLS